MLSTIRITSEQFLRGLGLSYVKPRLKRPYRPENPEEILNERVADALDDGPDDDPHNKREGDDEEGWVIDDDQYLENHTSAPVS